MAINYVHGDATAPIGDGAKIIVHVCNNVGAWGAGFVLAVSKRWRAPESVYRRQSSYPLGSVQFTEVAPALWVANLIGQRGVSVRAGSPPIDYDAIGTGLRRAAGFAERVGASIHMPRIGCGLAGGTWDQVEPIIQRELGRLEVIVYDYP